MSSSDRHPFLTNQTFDQDFLDACHDNFTTDITILVYLQAGGSNYISISDRNIMIDSQSSPNPFQRFYSARAKIPIIEKTIGEWLQGVLEFAVCNLVISNVDGELNTYQPSQSGFDSWIGNNVNIYFGIGNDFDNYKDNIIFYGRITDVGGFSRDLQSFKLIARDIIDIEDVEIPIAKMVKSGSGYFQYLSDELDKQSVPIVYGDWTVNITEGAASVPGFIINTEDPNMNGTVSRNNPTRCYISFYALSFIDLGRVYLLRNSQWTLLNNADCFADIGNKGIYINQNGATPYQWQTGDQIFVRVKGKETLYGAAYNDNAVAIVRDLLDLFISNPQINNTSFITYRDKSTPAQSAIANIKCRLWIQEPVMLMEQCLSLLEQVRLELYINNDYEYDINSMHFEDWPSQASITHEINEFDIVKDTWQPSIDVKNVFNRARGIYNWLPNLEEEAYACNYFRNAAAITQANNKIITKAIAFPNLYIESDVENQVTEIVRLASAYIEVIDCELTWRSILLDLSDFIKINVNVQNCLYDKVPAMVRKFAIDPNGMKVILRIWSFQMCPYPNYEPGYPNTVGGYDATIIDL